MTDKWTERLSDLVDNELDPEARRELEAHLAGCAECRETMAELNAVVGRGAALEDRPPVKNLWPGVAARISGASRVVDLDERRARRVSFSLPQLAAAAIGLMVVGASAAVWMADESASVPGVESFAARPVDATAIPVTSGEYDVAIAELEALLEKHRDRLDSSTVRVVEMNLEIIDRAIAEAEAALVADPSDVYLNTHLANTMQQKVNVLRRVAALVEG